MNILTKLKDGKYSILASNGYYSFDRGIKPIMDKLNENINYFKGLEVADKVVGKASAILLSLSGIKKVVCITLSKSAKKVLDEHNIAYEYEELTDVIINHKGDDVCPMEKAVLDVDDFEKAYQILKQKYEYK